MNAVKSLITKTQINKHNKKERKTCVPKKMHQK